MGWGRADSFSLVGSSIDTGKYLLVGGVFKYVSSRKRLAPAMGMVQESFVGLMGSQFSKRVCGCDGGGILNSEFMGFSRVANFLHHPQLHLFRGEKFGLTCFIVGHPGLHLFGRLAKE